MFVRKYRELQTSFYLLRLFYVRRNGAFRMKKKTTARKLLIAFLAFYSILTFIKLFMAEVRILGEAESGYLVIKAIPTLGNSFGGGEENAENRARHLGTWYFEEKYIFTGLDYDDARWVPVFFILIMSWWLLTPLVFLFALVQLVLSVWSSFKNRTITE